MENVKDEFKEKLNEALKLSKENVLLQIKVAMNEKRTEGLIIDRKVMDEILSDIQQTL